MPEDAGRETGDLIFAVLIVLNEVGPVVQATWFERCRSHHLSAFTTSNSIGL